MFFNHSVSDLVSRIRNGYAARKISVESPVSSLRQGILEILKNEGYILNYSKINDRTLSIHLKYHNSNPVISEIQTVSKPGRKIYCGFDKVPLVKNGLGVLIISTSQGILTDYEARTKKVGGEILLKVF